mmetsp:Transcript_32409/g.79562  ORF Transcript_32409/g.79562 Transcript_32409/m.79562 type:complete len:125 (+) Transcript_32409:845-1219(+)
MLAREDKDAAAEAEARERRKTLKELLDKSLTEKATFLGMLEEMPALEQAVKDRTAKRNARALAPPVATAEAAPSTAVDAAEGAGGAAAAAPAATENGQAAGGASRHVAEDKDASDDDDSESSLD